MSGSYFKSIFMPLKHCAMTEVLHKTPTSPYISRGLLSLLSVMPGSAVAPQMLWSLWHKNGPLVVGSVGTKPVVDVDNLVL